MPVAVNGVVPMGFNGCPKCGGCSWVGTIELGGSASFTPLGTLLAMPKADELKLALGEMDYDELAAAMSAVKWYIGRCQSALSQSERMIAHPDKSGDLYVCIADGEGTHETRICRGYEGVAAFYEEMCGRDQDDTLDSLKRSWDDKENAWRNSGTMLEIELYCAKFSVYAVSPAELERGERIASSTREPDQVRLNVAQGLWDFACHGGNADHSDRKKLLYKAAELLRESAASATRPMNDSEKRNDELNDLSGPGIRKT